MSMSTIIFKYLEVNVILNLLQIYICILMLNNKSLALS